MVYAVIKETPDSYARLYVFNSWKEYDAAVSDIDSACPFVADFAAHGRTYSEQKESIKDMAIWYSHAFWDFDGLSMEEIATLEEKFRYAGKRYGLLKEFKENAII